jgi:hypothetical protein
MRTLILPLGLLAIVGIAVSSACSATVSFSLPTGPNVQAVTPYGSCDTVDGYALISGVTVYTDFCGTLSCSDGTYYALCNGDAWAGCDCSIPSGYSEISWSDFGDAGGSAGKPETGSPETGSPETGSPETGSPETGSPETGSPETGGSTPDSGSADTGAE